MPPPIPVRMAVLVVLLVSATGASAFVPKIRAERTALRLFDNGDDDKTGSVNSASNSVDSERTTPQNTMVVKNLPTGEIKEVPFYDPYMEANTDVTMISPWAALLFGFPTLLLLNDGFHFLPSDGFFGKLQQMFQ
ncbi:hypothetical protein IV203_020560 [Nitzschia inconspicua]|uniref:Uncharacterized protein n=1 Tax=Nitzschia inconspicua TaxID=303405 RepID=A0A9K3KG85_9STRA|nr:hypothetical protein IV203_020560 [Nitzschia inconspicua]